jgi:kynurenine formamidase
MATMMVSLSYKLSENTPFYEGLAKPSLERLYDLSKGDTCNSFYLRTSNHCGTHVDGPWHFNPAGRKICDYEMNELVFHRPAILDVPVQAGHLIRASDLQGLSEIRGDCDILLLRTGFGAYRGQPKTYVEDAPGFSREAAQAVIDTLGELRALAVDFVSLASLKHEEQGAEAHRVFLGCAGYSDRNVLLIEDTRLPQDLKLPNRIIVAPWFFEGLDSAPCTVIAEYTESERN